MRFSLFLLALLTIETLSINTAYAHKSDEKYREAIFLLSSSSSINHKQAFTLLKTLAKSNHVQAQTVLGEIYLKGKGVVSDFTQGIYWLNKACARKHLEACRKLEEIRFLSDVLK